MTLVYYETMNECESAAIDRPTRRGPHRCAQKTARPTVFSCELVADYTSRVSKGSGRRPYGSEAEPMARGEPKSPRAVQPTLANQRPQEVGSHEEC